VREVEIGKNWVQALSAGFNTLMAKPADPDELVRFPDMPLKVAIIKRATSGPLYNSLIFPIPVIH
jgi:hypothetical protein